MKSRHTVDDCSYEYFEGFEDKKRGMSQRHNPYEEDTNEFALWEDGFCNKYCINEEELEKCCKKIFWT